MTLGRMQAHIDAYVADPTSANISACCTAIEREDDALGFEEALDALMDVPELFANEGRSAILKVLLRRAGPTDDPRRAQMAATAMTAALQIALADETGVMRLDFVTALRSAPQSTDATWALAAARCIGLADAHFAEPSLRAGLRSSLRALAEHPDAAVDAAVELAFTRVTDAFEANTVDDMIAGLDVAAAELDAAAEAEEGRIDAILMGACLLGLVAFAREAPASTIAAYAAKAEALVVERTLYSWPSAVPIAHRRAQEALWGELIESLSEAQEARHQSHWGDSARAAQALADAVRASRTVRVAPGAGGPSAIVAPTISAGIADRYAHRATLAAAIEQKALPEEVTAEVVQMLAQVETAPNESGPEGIGDVIGADTAQKLRATLDPDTFHEIAEAIREASPARPQRDTQWHEAYDTVLEGLAGAPDLAGPHGHAVKSVLASLVDFVCMCLTHQLGHQGDALDYLGDPDAKEKRLSDHLASWLTASAGHQVDREVPDQGSGGRTDVRVVIKNDRFVVECKRERTITENSLQGHLAQTARYTGVSLRVSALAILDLSDKNEGHSRGLDSSLAVHPIPTRDEDAPIRYVVTVIVPGNRAATPSEIGKATRRASSSRPTAPGSSRPPAS